jgi:hypothetical protein
MFFSEGGSFTPVGHREGQAFGLPGAVVRVLAQHHGMHEASGVSSSARSGCGGIDHGAFGERCSRRKARAAAPSHWPGTRRRLAPALAPAATARRPRLQALRLCAGLRSAQGSSLAASAPWALSAEQLGQRLARIRRAHEGFADQEGVHAGARMRCTSSRWQDARLGHQQAVGRHLLQHAQRRVEAHLEGAQVAVVDAQQPRLQLQRPLQFLASCTSTSTAMSRLRAMRFQLRHLRVVQAGGDQQDAVGAHGRALVDLVRSTMKSLRSTGRSQDARACFR